MKKETTGSLVLVLVIYLLIAAGIAVMGIINHYKIGSVIAGFLVLIGVSLYFLIASASGTDDSRMEEIFKLKDEVNRLNIEIERERREKEILDRDCSELRGRIRRLEEDDDAEL